MGIILFWLFRLRVGNCTRALEQVVPLVPLTTNERLDICVKLVTNEEASNETINNVVTAK
jgi:hypothetical protein